MKYQMNYKACEHEDAILLVLQLLDKPEEWDIKENDRTYYMYAHTPTGINVELSSRNIIDGIYEENKLIINTFNAEEIILHSISTNQLVELRQKLEEIDYFHRNRNTLAKQERMKNFTHKMQVYLGASR